MTDSFVRSFVLAIVFLLGFFSVHGQDSGEKKIIIDFDLESEFEYRFFWDDAQFLGQESHFPAISLQPELSLDWDEGYKSVNFTGFFRLDRDSKRTHWDIRELYYQNAVNNWEINIGLKKVYWGVTESNHLVDIINQTDQVETFDGEQKLGQPMINFTYFSDKLGNFEFFYLPYHRKRTFGGEDGRLRFGVVIDQDDLGYESSKEEWRQDLAFRWSHYFGITDIGLSYFYGNGREPFFSIDDTTGSFDAFYPVIHQMGLDIQLTHNAFLWKLEAIHRMSELQDFTAIVAGLEYTFSNVNGKGLDIGVLAEYLYDSRGELAITALDNDIFIGTRFALNDEDDTSILFGGIVDVDKNSQLYFVEFSRRIAKDLTLELESRIFNGIDSREFILTNFMNDSFMRISVSKYW